MNYVDNKEFHKLLTDYRNNKSKKNENAISRIFFKICEHYIRVPKFINYSEDIKADAVSDGVFFMWRYGLNSKSGGYDVTLYDNPLAYFTQFIHNAMLQNITKLHKKSEIFTSMTYLENLDEFNGSEMTRKYKEVPKEAVGDLKIMLAEIENIDREELKG